MSWFWFFFLFFIPFLVLVSILSARRRRLRYQGNAILHQVGSNQQQVVYSVPTQVYVQPVHNNFPNSQHVSPSTFGVEQRLNHHYAQQNQPPPSYAHAQQQPRY